MSCQQMENQSINYHVNYCALSPKAGALFTPNTMFLHIILFKIKGAFYPKGPLSPLYPTNKHPIC